MPTTFDVKNTFDLNGSLTMLSEVRAINMRLKTLLLTERGELFGDPGFGAGLMEFAYLQNSSAITGLLKELLLEAIQKYDTGVSVENTSIELTPVEGSLLIDISYMINGQITTLSSEIALGEG